MTASKTKTTTKATKLTKAETAILQGFNKTVDTLVARLADLGNQLSTTTVELGRILKEAKDSKIIEKTYSADRRKTAFSEWYLAHGLDRYTVTRAMSAADWQDTLDARKGSEGIVVTAELAKALTTLGNKFPENGRANAAKKAMAMHRAKGQTLTANAVKKVATAMTDPGKPGKTTRVDHPTDVGTLINAVIDIKSDDLATWLGTTEVDFHSERLERLQTAVASLTNAYAAAIAADADAETKAA